MNTYIEALKHGRVVKRYSVTQMAEYGRIWLVRSLVMDGFETNQLDSEIELETGTL